MIPQVVACLLYTSWSPASLDQVKYDVMIPFIRQVSGPMDYTPVSYTHLDVYKRQLADRGKFLNHFLNFMFQFFLY